MLNTTATAVALKLCRLSTAGTPAATLTSANGNTDPTTSIALLKNTYTVAPTITDLGFRCVLGAAVGSGFVWTFEDYDLTTLVAANAGIGVVVENGTGQALQTYWKWPSRPPTV